MAESHELVSWALGAEIPDASVVGRPGGIGKAAIKLVLVCLANHANREGRSWPSKATIATEVKMSKRDVQNAIPVLEKLGLIMRDGTVGRATAYRMSYDGGDCTGYPVQSSAKSRTGNRTGNRTGYPVPNGTKENLSPNPYRATIDSHEASSSRTEDHSGPSSSGELEDYLVNRYLESHDAAAELVAEAKRDPQGWRSLKARLQRPEEVDKLRAAVHAREAGQRELVRRNGPRCEEHGDEPAKGCRACLTDVKLGHRFESFVGRFQPRCRDRSLCGRPVDGSYYCSIHDMQSAAAG